MKLKSFECMEMRREVCKHRPTALGQNAVRRCGSLGYDYFASLFSVSAQAAYFATFSWLSVLSLPLART